MPEVRREPKERDYSPRSEMAERAILNEILYNNDLLQLHCADLEPWEFSFHSHNIMYAKLRELIYAGEKNVDVIVLMDRLGREKVDNLGGTIYFLSLSENIPTHKLSHLYVPQHVAIVKEQARRRDMIRVAEEMLDKVCAADTPSTEIAMKMAEFMNDVANQSETNDIEKIGAYLEKQGPPEAMFEQMASKDGVMVGFKELDRMTGGFQKQDLIIVAARPSMGKTAWAANVMYQTAVRDRKVTAAFTLEQQRRYIVRRMLAASTRIDYNDIKANNLTPREKQDLIERRGRIVESPLYMEDRPGLTVSKIKAKCMRLKSQLGQLDIVIIDQLSKISNADVYRHGMQTRDIVGAQTEALKRMAQDLDVPVVVFNQLSRETGKRKDFIPVLADLKESGDIEEDADVVVFLHRPEYYDKGDEDLKGKGMMIVAKQREGATGTINCIYQGELMLWADHAPKMQDSAYYQRSFNSAEDYLIPTYSDDPRFDR